MTALHRVPFVALVVAAGVWLTAGLGLISAAPAGAAPLAEEAQDFIRDLADRTVAALEDESLTTAGRVQRMGDLFTRNFAVEDIAQWVLGRYWRGASAAERQEYLRLFEDFIVYGYARRFGDFAGQRLQVLGGSAVEDGAAIVRSEIVQGRGEKNIQVDWRVSRGQDGRLQIRDVAVEGVSMAQTQRSDFVATVRQQGGSVADLNRVLRSKVSQLKSELGLAG